MIAKKSIPLDRVLSLVAVARDLRVKITLDSQTYSNEWVYFDGIVIADEDIDELLADPEAWLAYEYGVSKEVFGQWNATRPMHAKCTATTTKGKQCGQRIIHKINNPIYFISGVHDRCWAHKKKLAEAENICGL